VSTLCGLTEVIKSNMEPDFKNFGEKPANGPNKSDFLLSINRVSRCGTDIGGAPTLALPYTLAWCCSTISGLLHTMKMPLTGNPPIRFPSGIPDFCSKCK